jgi:hypothetical protein
MWGLANRSFSDLVIEVDATQVSAPANNNNAYGVMCRVQPSGNDGYLLRISGDGFYAVHKIADGNFEELVEWTRSEAIWQGNATNHLRAVCDGADLALFVNGELVAQASDATFLEGDIALTATTFEEELTEVHFDNLVVSAPAEGVAELPPTVPVPTPRPNGALILEDDFDDTGGARALFGPEFMTFDYVGGEGRLATTYKEGVLPAMYATPTVADFLAEFNFRAESSTPGSGYGLICRSDDAEDGLAWYYQVLIQPADGSAEFGSWGDGEWVVEQAYPLPSGLAAQTGSNHVRVEAVGGEFRVFFNGTFVFEVADTTLTAPGIFGLSMVSGIADPDAVYFDNLRVYEPTEVPPTPAPPAPTPTEVPTVAPTAIPSPTFGPVTFSSDFDHEAEEPVNVGRRFDYGITTLYAYWPYEGVEAGTAFRWDFYHDGSPFYGQDDVLDDTSGHSWEWIFETSGEPLDPGTYQIVVKVGGQTVLSDECVIDNQ